MILGDPYKFSFLIERIPEWEVNGWKNGIMFVAINGKIYTKDIQTTTFNSEIPDLLDCKSAFMNTVLNTEFYNKSTIEIFSHISDITFPQSVMIIVI